MEDTKIVPQWMLTMLQGLHEQRDKMQKIADEKQAACEAARRACVVPDQQLEHIKDAIAALGKAIEWTSGTVWEAPL